MTGRRRGARTGRGWDAKPPAPARPARPGDDGTGWSGPSDGEAAEGAEGRFAAGGGRRPAGRFGSASGDGPASDDGSPRAERAARRQAERDPHELAREICLRQLSVRPRTRSELAAAMRSKGVADEVAEAVLDRYDEVGMIDDAAFARAWVSSRHHGKGLASRALGQELRRRGVEAEVVTEALAELDDETQAQTAYELAVRKLRTTRGEPDAVFRRVVGALARKGYPGGVAVRAVKDALAARSAEDAELAELLDPDLFDTPEQ
ncbi:regulatory protein RecX [Catellatospora sichuanensis]|uniref:regulatory protein RecX n=1 Tax=Catellatospora sichuanensis TaxID=1969805 RepID=UPI0011840EBB|nr:regulatory protein RecX [Catellatospora sichuanensis]